MNDILKGRRFGLSYYEQYAAFINKRYPFPFPDYVFEFKTDIDGARLQQAVEKAFTQHPAFSLTLREKYGTFFLEAVDAQPVISECEWKSGYTFGEDGLMWTISYNGRRMVFTAFHLLCDGMGAISFLRDVLQAYCVENTEFPQLSKQEILFRCANGYREAVPQISRRWKDIDYNELDSLDISQFKAMDAPTIIYRLDFPKAAIKKQAEESGTSTSAVISYYLAKAMAQSLADKNKTEKGTQLEDQLEAQLNIGNDAVGAVNGSEVSSAQNNVKAKNGVKSETIEASCNAVISDEKDINISANEAVGKVSVAVVADLRSRFPSQSDRNFTAESNLIYDDEVEKSWDRNQVQQDLRRQLDEFVDAERQKERIAQEHEWQLQILRLSDEDKIANRNFLFQTFCTLRANICYSHLVKLDFSPEVEEQLVDFHIAGAKGFSPRVCVFGSNLQDKITLTISQYLRDDIFVQHLTELLAADEVSFKKSTLELHGNMSYSLQL